MGKGLQVIAHAQVEGKAVGYTNRILGEGGVFTGVRVGKGGAEILHVVARHSVRPGAQGRELGAANHGRESPGIYFDVVENVFPAEERGKDRKSTRLNS